MEGVHPLTAFEHQASLMRTKTPDISQELEPVQAGFISRSPSEEITAAAVISTLSLFHIRVKMYIKQMQNMSG